MFREGVGPGFSDFSRDVGAQAGGNLRELDKRNARLQRLLLLLVIVRASHLHLHLALRRASSRRRARRRAMRQG